MVTTDWWKNVKVANYVSTQVVSISSINVLTFLQCETGIISTTYLERQVG